MKNLLAWLKYARAESLLLVFSSINFGLVATELIGVVHLLPVVSIYLTAGSLQLLCNLTNDLGDAKRGADDHPLGLRNPLVVGELGALEINKAIYILVLFSIIFGIAALWFSGITLKEWLIFLGLGAVSIAAAWLYTLGNKPYGYRALGDLSVFIFFGLLAVLGTLFLQTHQLSVSGVLLGVAAGAYSVGVLNINNMRDLESDLAVKKYTMVNLMGMRTAKIYHVILLLLALGCLKIVILINLPLWMVFVLLPNFFFGIWHISLVLKAKTPDDFAPLLVQVVMQSMMASLILLLSVYWFS